MAYRQVRGRAASLSPKSRPKMHLPAQSALCLRRNPLPAACTVRKTHRFVNGGRVPYNGQAGAAIGCSGSASDFSHRLPTLRTHGRMGTSLSRSFAHTFPGHFPSNKPPTRPVYSEGNRLRERPPLRELPNHHRELWHGICLFMLLPPTFTSQ